MVKTIIHIPIDTIKALEAPNITNCTVFKWPILFLLIFKKFYRKKNFLKFLAFIFYLPKIANEKRSNIYFIEINRLLIIFRIVFNEINIYFCNITVKIKKLLTDRNCKKL